MFKKRFIVFLFLAVFLFGKSEQFSDIVKIKWLKHHLNDKDLVIIDVRKEELFKRGHIKHAINLPVFKYFFDLKNNYKLPKLSFLQNVFRKAGINSNSKVVVYGNNELIWAARCYWVGKVLGLKNIGLLESGYSKWKKENFPVETKIYKAKKSNFVPKVNNKYIETKLSVLMSIGKKYIIDGRGKEYYLGLKSHAKRYGHIPSALNYPGSKNYVNKNGDSYIKTLDKLKKIYKKLPKDKEIILYCEDGADAALNFLILKKLGYKVSVYDGSWLEWGNDFALPIENPSKNMKKSTLK